MVAFSQFHCECQSLQNVSPATWYGHSFKWLRSEAPSKDELKDAMIRMREKDLKATGCNSVIEYSCHVRRRRLGARIGVKLSQATKAVTRNR
jgi:hypothetical protein